MSKWTFYVKNRRPRRMSSDLEVQQDLNTLWKQFAASEAETDHLLSSRPTAASPRRAFAELGVAERFINGLVLTLTVLISCVPVMSI